MCARPAGARTRPGRTCPAPRAPSSSTKARSFFFLAGLLGKGILGKRERRGMRRASHDCLNPLGHPSQTLSQQKSPTCWQRAGLETSYPGRSGNNLSRHHHQTFKTHSTDTAAFP